MTTSWRYGSQQSPIKIDTASAIPILLPLDYLVIGYPNEPCAGYFDHTSHEFRFDIPPALQYQDRDLFLTQIHIHSRSEHWLDGNDFDFEIHFVHRVPSTSTDPASNADNTSYVVLAAFFKERPGALTPNAIRSLNAALPTKAPADGQNEKTAALRTNHSINPYDFLPTNLSQFFRYEGSLTTPDKNELHKEPANWDWDDSQDIRANESDIHKERVSWVVYPQLIEVDPNDVAGLKTNAQKPARNPQQLNRRFVLRNFW